MGGGFELTVPPERALPRTTMSGLAPSHHEASSLPVLLHPVWTSS